MRCFYHQEKEAVGSCKSCGKGLCVDCATDLKKGLACREHCEEDVRALIQLIERNIKLSATSANIIQSSRRVRLNAAIFNLIIGAAFLAWGLIDGMTFLTVIGSCFIVYGFIGLLQARSTTKNTPSPTEH